MQNSKIDSKMIIDSKLRKINFFETTIIIKQICDIFYTPGRVIIASLYIKSLLNWQ